MYERRITHTYKDRDGKITFISNPGEAWSPQAVATTCAHIRGDLISYYVDAAGWRADVGVVSGAGGDYLRTYADESSVNNLDNLPEIGVQS